MTDEEIVQRLLLQFEDKILEYSYNTFGPVITISNETAHEIFEGLHKEPDLKYNALLCMSGVDTGKILKVVYHLFSIEHRNRIVIKVALDREKPHIGTVSHLWNTANWHEREIFDMYGIIFDGHPNLRRILCPEDWHGHPLRKDYIVQELFHGLRVSYPGEENEGEE